MNSLFYCLTLYYGIILFLLYFATRKYLNINNLPLTIILSLYLVATALSIFGLINDLNVISVDIETKNYLDELDFTVEIPETVQDNQTNKSSSNIFIKFLALFNENNIYNSSIKNELTNAYYMNNIRATYEYNKLDWIDIREKYAYASAHNKEVLYFIECFTDVLDDLEAIKDNLSSGRKN
uniref:hypothetical protein n=1 Tax=Purpureocillium takamizusanense TaxID=2060973 RepID=UPI001FA6DA27|nr:hypothetical protein MRV25_mgp19 [Purpureocillium takamizusanense]UNI92574.1 hypothetical protein [Purpureocillium takamizusanense]